MAQAVVALESVPRDAAAAAAPLGTLRAVLRRALENAEWRRFLPEGRDVSLKVNLGWNRFVPGSITSPLVVEALIEELRPRVGRIFLVEADTVANDVAPAFHASGMDEVCRRTGATWVNLTRAPTVEIACPENTVLKTVVLPRLLRETVLITVPVMKTHAKTRITGALKNQWGCLPKMRHQYHPVLDDAIADLNHALRPAFAVMDGTIGLEGDGPKSGAPRIADRVLCSGDPVALDTIQAVTMGIDPGSVRHLATCAARGIGTNDLDRIEVRGLDPRSSAISFRPARHNPVSLVETLLRRSVLQRLIFETPALRLCLIATDAYYRVWTRRHAPRHWRTACEHPVYGPQWRAVRPASVT